MEHRRRAGEGGQGAWCFRGAGGTGLDRHASGCRQHHRRARTEAQLKDNLAAAKLKLSAEELTALEDVSLQPLDYPYGTSCASAANRLGPADMALHAPHVARSKPICEFLTETIFGIYW